MIISKCGAKRGEYDEWVIRNIPLFRKLKESDNLGLFTPVAPNSQKCDALVAIGVS
jgi:hypothetical protein